MMRKSREDRPAACFVLLLAVLGALLAACSRDGAGGPRQTLTVFAAASLTEAFSDLASRFENANPGFAVDLYFAGSHRLRAQLEMGAHADVFASADIQEMDAAVHDSLVVPGSVETFVHNRLVVILPRSNPAHLTSLVDLGRPGVKLDLAADVVPAGRYTLEMLDFMSTDPFYGSDFRQRVLENVVSLEDDIKAVVSKVRLGEVDAGVVYLSDVTGAEMDLIALTVPDALNPLVSYVIAPLIESREPILAADFIAFILSPEGQRTLANYGFTPLAAAQP